MIANIKKYIKENRDFLVASGVMVGSALADSALTLININQYGIEFESNPVMKASVEHLGEVAGLLLPKIAVLGYCIYTAKKMNESEYRTKGEYLLYGGALTWSAATFLNLYSL